MSYAINNLPSCITIGRETETAVTEIRIDCAEWLDRWPDMDVSVIVRTGRGAIYIPANLTMEGKTLVWCVDDVDTSILNKSTMEITGIAPGRHKLSEKVGILVDERLAGTTGETPDPMKPWVDRVIEAANTVGDARDDAVSAKDEAFDSANVAYKAAFDARESEKNAHASEQEAAQSANIAKDAEENTRATLVTVNGLAEYAKSSAEMAKGSEEKSLQNANNAGTYATSAKESEIIARESGETAKTSAQSAQTSAGSAAESANQAKRSEEAAKGYADNTGEYARIATEKAQKATEQANSAGVSATSAEESANRASASEQNAATSAQEAKSSADSTKGYSESANEAAVNASDSAREAQVSAENAAASANNAEASKASAQVSAENARVSSQNAEDALQELRDKIASGEFKGEPGAPGKDAVVDATLTQSGQAADAKVTGDAIGQLKDDVAAITPDDTAVDGKPWTSKKIVDTLCMPIEATGNPVQVYPVEGYPLGVKVSWEPTQAGEGDPSPDNIRPITGRDAVSVTRCGRNLLDFGDTYAEGYNITGIQNFLTPNTTYSFMVKKSGGIAFAVFLANNLIINIADKQLNLTKVYVEEGGIKTFTTPADMKEYSYVILAGGKSGIVDVFPDVEFQLELGSTATPYEPYTGSTTDIALPETVYGGTLDVETGVVMVEKKLCTLTGDEAYAAYSYVDAFMLGMFDGAAIIDNSWTTEWKCTHFPSKPFYDTDYFSGAADAFAQEAGGSYMVAFRKSGIAKGDVDAFRAWIKSQYDSGTPVQFWYELKTPYTIQLTEQQIAALSGVNTLYTDAGTLTVTGREDPRHTIVTLTDRIAALESAAAGV